MTRWCKKCHEISQGDGWELLNDVLKKTPIGINAERNKEAQKLNNVINDLNTSYNKENRGSSGRIRVLSTVANHFSNKELKKAFPCSDYEITEARRHATFVGPGVMPPKSTRIKRYRLPVEDIAFVVNFLHHPDNATRSSHRVASCEGKKSSWLSDLFDERQQPVMWLRDSKNHLYAKYKAECSKAGKKPISETKFRQGLNAGNFKEMAQMVGLCNICDEIGAKNWGNLDDLINEFCSAVSNTPPRYPLHSQEVTEEFEDKTTIDKTTVHIIDITDQNKEYQQQNPLPIDSPVLMIPVGISNKLPDYACNKDGCLSEFTTRAKVLKGHLLSTFPNELEIESPCPFHCMSWLLKEKSTCQNKKQCDVCLERFTLFDDLHATISASKLTHSSKCHFQEQLAQIQAKLHLYIGHLVRRKYQRYRFMREIEELKPGRTLAVCDYMMKLLLQKFREPQRDWYAKKGVSVHGSMFFYKSSDSSEIEIEIHDVFSNGDCVQNWYFTASAFEATVNNFAATHEATRTLVIWSDNGPHYHNTSLILWLMPLTELCPIKIERYSFFEAQKGKTSLDSHFATFKFVLKCWMKKGNDILESNNIVEGTKHYLKGTHVYELHIDRSKEPASAKTLNGITTFADFTFIYDQSQCNAIDAREQTSKCKATRFTKEKLDKLWPYLSSKSVSTGVTSEFNSEKQDDVLPRYMKKAKVMKTKDSVTKSIPSDMNDDTNNTCENCGKTFLRKRCLVKHFDLSSITPPFGEGSN